MRFGVAGTILGMAVTSEAGRKRAQHGKMICSRRQSSVIYCVMSIPNKVKLFYSFCCFQAWKKSFFSIWLFWRWLFCHFCARRFFLVYFLPGRLFFFIRRIQIYRLSLFSVVAGVSRLSSVSEDDKDHSYTHISCV